MRKYSNYKKLKNRTRRNNKVGFVQVGSTRLRHGTSKLEDTILKYFPNAERSVLVKGFGGKIYIVDGYDRKKNEIIEILGSYWHGDLRKYRPTDINIVCKKSMGQLYLETKNRLQLFKDLNFNVRFIWEEDWKRSHSLGRLYTGKADNLF